MIHSETLRIAAAFATVAGGLHGFSVHRKSGASGPYLGRIRYRGDGADRDIIVQEGLWYALAKRVERLQLATLTDGAEMYLTTSDDPDDIVTEVSGDMDAAPVAIGGSWDVFAPSAVGASWDALRLDGGGVPVSLDIDVPRAARGLILSLTQAVAGVNVTWRLLALLDDGFTFVLGTQSVGAVAGSWYHATTAEGVSMGAGGWGGSGASDWGGGMPRRLRLDSNGANVAATWSVRGMWTRGRR